MKNYVVEEELKESSIQKFHDLIKLSFIDLKTGCSESSIWTEI